MADPSRLPGRTPWLRLVQLILIGIETGRFVDQWFILALSLRDLDATALSAAVRALGEAAKLSMPATAAVVALLFVAVLVKERDLRSRRGKVTVAAFVLFLGVLAITVLHEMPLIARIEGMGTASPAAGWQALRKEWLAGHTLRTLLGLAIFVAVALAFRMDGRSDRQT